MPEITAKLSTALADRYKIPQAMLGTVGHKCAKYFLDFDLWLSVRYAGQSIEGIESASTALARTVVRALADRLNLERT